MNAPTLVTPAGVRSQLQERLNNCRDMRRAMKARGWGDTPALDRTIADLEKQLAEVAGGT